MATATRWDQAVKQYKGKIRTAAWNASYKIPFYDPEDLEQELLVVLWESIDLYDPNRGSTFNTFFWMRAKQKIGMLIRHAETKRRKAELVSLSIEGVEAAVNEALVFASAEDAALAHILIAERLKGGTRTHVKKRTASSRRRAG